MSTRKSHNAIPATGLSRRIDRRIEQATADAPPPGLRLFELQNVLVYGDDPRQCPRSDDARAVWLHHADDAHVAQTSGATTLYVPLALRDGDGEYVGLPKLRPGARLWCHWNRQSGRWEATLGEPLPAYRAKLAEALVAGGTAAATIWIVEPDGQTDSAWGEVTARDWFLGAGQSLAAGTPVRIEWFADDGRWYVTAASCT